MRGRFLVKVSLIALFNCPVILRYLLVWVYLILSEPTQFQPTQNHIFGQFFVENHFCPIEPNDRTKTVRREILWRILWCPRHD